MRYLSSKHLPPPSSVDGWFALTSLWHMSLPSSTVNQQEVSMNGRILKRVMTIRINRQSGGWSRGSLWKISGDYFFNIFHLHYICLPSSSEIIHLFSPSDKSSPNPKLTNPLRPGRAVFWSLGAHQALWLTLALPSGNNSALVVPVLRLLFFRLSREEHESRPHWVTRNICWNASLCSG